jgi:hypothetical protein
MGCSAREVICKKKKIKKNKYLRAFDLKWERELRSGAGEVIVAQFVFACTTSVKKAQSFYVGCHRV